MSFLAENNSDNFNVRAQHIEQLQDPLDHWLTEAFEGTLPETLKPELCARLGEIAMRRST